MDNANTARDKLRTIHQKGSMMDYCAKFNNVVVSLPDSDMGDIIHSFVYGLKSHLHPLVKAQLAQRMDATLTDAMTIVVRLDKYAKGQPGNPLPRTFQPPNPRCPRQLTENRRMYQPQ